MKEQPYHSLIVWRVSHEFVLEIYRCTEKFPKQELFGLVSQLRRAGVSIPTNIVEGHGRKTLKDQLNFCFISRGSLRECNYLIELAHDLKYLTDEDFEKLQNLSARVGYLLFQYIEGKNKNLTQLNSTPSSPSTL